MQAFALCLDRRLLLVPPGLVTGVLRAFYRQPLILQRFPLREFLEHESLVCFILPYTHTRVYASILPQRFAYAVVLGDRAPDPTHPRPR